MWQSTQGGPKLPWYGSCHGHFREVGNPVVVHVWASQAQRDSSKMLVCLSISPDAFAACVIEQLITVRVGTSLQCWCAKSPFIHLWPSTSNPPQMTVPEYRYVGSQPFTCKGPLTKSFKINFQYLHYHGSLVFQKSRHLCEKALN